MGCQSSQQVGQLAFFHLDRNPIRAYSRHERINSGCTFGYESEFKINDRFTIFYNIEMIGRLESDTVPVLSIPMGAKFSSIIVDNIAKDYILFDKSIVSYLVIHQIGHSSQLLPYSVAEFKRSTFFDLPVEHVRSILRNSVKNSTT